MKTASILLAFLLSTISVLSQEVKSFDVILGAEKAYRINRDIERLAHVGTRPAERGSQEDWNNGWRFGINLNRSLPYDFVIKFGLRVMNTGFDTGELYEYRPFPAFSGGEIIEYKNVFDFYFVEFPIGLRQEFGQKRITTFIEYGIAPTFLVGSKATRIDSFGSSDFELENLNRVHIVAFFSVGYIYKINELASIFLQPIFRIHASPLQKDLDYKDYLFNIGFEIGFRKSIK